MPVSIAVFFGVMLGFQLGLLRGSKAPDAVSPPPVVEAPQEPLAPPSVSPAQPTPLLCTCDAILCYSSDCEKARCRCEPIPGMGAPR